MEEVVKVLYFVDTMLIGGIQTLIIDWLSNFDAKKVKVDVLVLDDGVDAELERKLKSLNCTVYKLEGVWINSPLDYIKYSKKMDGFFKEHNNYDAVHMHSSSKNYMFLKYAKKYGIKKRIAHSHNIEFQTSNKLKIFVGNIFKLKLKQYATDYLACSEDAGKWLFGKKITRSRKFSVIHNAIEYDKFKFDQVVRDRIRGNLQIKSDEILVGHVGRFVRQKNHKYLIEIFNELSTIDSKYKLLLLGDGEERKNIEDMIERYGISKKVILEGFKTNINEYMQAMDVFLLPSLYEGLPVVGVEAQASGLPCIVTKDKIPYEAKINANFEFCSISVSPKVWAKNIHEADKIREDSEEKFREKQYFIADVIGKLESIYGEFENTFRR